jgi:hypothetical protein
MEGALAGQQLMDNFVYAIDLTVKQTLDPGLLKQKSPH